MATVATNKMEWRRAWRALRGLIADSQRTDLAFEVTEALAGNSFERAFQRFVAHPDGRALLAERPSLLETLSDRAALAALPPDSFGRAYLQFMQSANLTAAGLVEADAMAGQRRAPRTMDADREFFDNRVRDMHDLWHVLTGYGMDEAGEAANLAFNLGQIASPGIALIVVAGAAVGPKDLRLWWPRYLYRAWRRGHRAVNLTVARYERLLPLPLDEVRQSLRIEPADVAHPDGVMVGNRSADHEQWVMQASH